LIRLIGVLVGPLAVREAHWDTGLVIRIMLRLLFQTTSERLNLTSALTPTLTLSRCHPLALCTVRPDVWSRDPPRVTMRTLTALHLSLSSATGAQRAH
jgi:hypothetical protein